ncbi:MAG: methyltransferase domain-containing protein [Candidatus Rokuibacteriota bacterium]
MTDSDTPTRGPGAGQPGQQHGDARGEAVDGKVLSAQQHHWAATYAANRDMYGTSPSAPVVSAAELFTEAGVREVVELGAGQGRDTLYLAEQGFRVHALDYAPGTVEAIRSGTDAAGLAERVSVAQHDVREPLPFPDNSADACYSHMLFCMALTSPQLHRLAGEVRRVVRPGGLVVYTARTTADPHFRVGIPRGDDMYEHGGFIVHFFDPALIKRLASGYELIDVADLVEGDLPRRLARVTMRVPLTG